MSSVFGSVPTADTSGGDNDTDSSNETGKPKWVFDHYCITLLLL